jgi:hypothetical protein
LHTDSRHGSIESTLTTGSLTMIRLTLVILMGLLCSNDLLATNIYPVEKLGQLQVFAPDLSGLNGVFNPAKLRMEFTVDSKVASIPMSKVNDVAAGVGCLKINYTGNYYYSASQCGIKIEEKKLTTIRLSAVQFSWDINQFNIDFGPQPEFSFSSKDANRIFQVTLNPMIAEYQKLIFLIPSMTIQTSFMHPDTGVMFTQSNIVSESQATALLLQPPQELRGFVQLDFVDGKPTFETLKDRNYIAANDRKSEPNYSYSYLPSNYSSLPNGFSQINDSFLNNIFKFGFNAENQKIKAYPILSSVKNRYYDLAINEHSVRLSLESGKTVRVPIATLNVHHYRDNQPGTFKVFSDKTKRGSLVEHRHPDEQSTWRVSETFFPTNSSLFFPIGHNYRLDFYIVDDLGRNTLQDQVAVDLTHE